MGAERRMRGLARAQLVLLGERQPRDVGEAAHGLWAGEAGGAQLVAIERGTLIERGHLPPVEDVFLRARSHRVMLPQGRG